MKYLAIDSNILFAKVVSCIHVLYKIGKTVGEFPTPLHFIFHLKQINIFYEILILEVFTLSLNATSALH